MGKLRQNSKHDPRDMTPVWEARGYRGASVDIKAEEWDSKGEEAYQKAFAAGAKFKPPRVPNPASYPNSSSARAYIEKADQRFFLPASSDIKPAGQPSMRFDSYPPSPVPNAHRQSRSPLEPRAPYSHVQGHTNGVATSQSQQMPPGQYHGFPDPRARPADLPPPVLEPKSYGPVGPSNPLR